MNAIQQRSLGVGLLFGVASLIVALIPSTREQFFHSYLLGFMLWLGISLGSMAFLMIQHLTGGKWGMVIRRQLEAAMNTLPSARLTTSMAPSRSFNTSPLIGWESCPLGATASGVVARK